MNTAWLLIAIFSMTNNGQLLTNSVTIDNFGSEADCQTQLRALLVGIGEDPDLTIEEATCVPYTPELSVTS